MNQTCKKLVLAGQPHQRRHPLEDGGVKITTFVPLQFKKRGIQKVVVGPPGVEEPVTVNIAMPVIPPTNDAVLLRALGRGVYWQGLLDSGAMANTGEIADQEGVHRTLINDHLRLALLAPSIIEAALQGTLPRTVTLLGLLREGFSDCWQAQSDQILG